VFALLLIVVRLSLPRPLSPKTEPATLGASAPADSTPRLRRPVAALSAQGDDRFLIVGLTQDQHRTDTIMVMQWDASRHVVRVLGVPRDLPVDLVGIGTTKLVHAYAVGGITRAVPAVEKVLGIPIHHYVVFSLPATRHLVDLIGGVPLTVEERMKYTDRAQGLVIDLSPGPQILDGGKAEQYLRFRHDREADIGRIRRQQHFLRATLAAVRRPVVWVRLPQIIQAARAQVNSDLTVLQLLDWLRTVERLTPDEVSASTISGQVAVYWDELARMRLDFWQPDPADLQAKVRWLLTGSTGASAKP
jgi:LCP family protein required for cell wall assembly